MKAKFGAATRASVSDSVDWRRAKSPPLSFQRRAFNAHRYGPRRVAQAARMSGRTTCMHTLKIVSSGLSLKSPKRSSRSI